MARGIKRNEVGAIDINLLMAALLGGIWFAPMFGIGMNVVAFVALSTSLLLVGVVTAADERKVGGVSRCLPRYRAGNEAQYSKILCR